MPGKTALSSPRGVTDVPSTVPTRARRSFRFGLVPRIVSLVAVTALVTGVAVGIAGVHNSRDALHDQILTDSQAEADLAARFTERYIANSQESLQKFAALPGWEQSINNSIANAGPALETIRALSPALENLTLYDIDGNRLATARAVLPAVNVKGRDWFDGAVSTRAPYLGAGYLGLNTGTPVAPYAIPLFRADGSVMAVMLGSISLTQLTEALAFANEAVDSRVILIDNRGEGTILSHPESSLILQPASAGANLKAPLVLDERAAMATEDASGESVLLAVSPISNLSWSVVAERSGATTFTLLGRVTSDMLTLGGPLVLLACLLSGLLAMQIARPLINLRKAAQAVAAGTPGRRVGLTRKDEVGDLGRAFDLMSQALEDRNADLQRAHNELEGRVRDRTADLARAVASYGEIFNTATDAIYIHDIETGRILDVNEKTCALMGMTKEEILSLPPEEQCWESPYSMVEAAQWMQAAATKGPQTFEWLARVANDEALWVEVNLRRGVIDGEDRILAMVRDVSERHLADERLRDSENRFRSLVEKSHDGISLLNAEGVLTYSSPASERILGYTHAELVNLGGDGLVHPDDAEARRAAHQRMFATPGAVADVTCRCRYKEGSWRWLEITYTNLLEDPAVRAVVVNFRDISEKRETEERLAAAEQSFKTLVESSGDGIVIIDAGGSIVHANPSACQMFGYADGLAGRPLEDLVPESLRQAHRKHRENYAANPQARAMGLNLQLEGRRSDGSLFPVDISLTPYQTPAGPVVAAAVRDVTWRREMEAEIEAMMEELRRSNSELEQFAYVASHDLQEPLRMVRNYTQLLERRYGNKLDRDADTFIGFAVEGAGRMQQLINDLLELSRVGAKGKDLAAIESQTALDLALRNLKTAIEEAGARVEVEGELPSVYGDDGQLTQVFQNLISNAIKFHGDEPAVVRVSSEREDAYWRFAVSDNGIGIEPQYWDRVFVIFQRLHARDEYAGTGIGLALCKRIVERHGGRIWVDSKAGKGATFYFTLQAAKQRSASKPALAGRAA
ncbi:MAG TPA: PAS domain S-box protein [Dehalococcoidia bacterium]|nr:PAS domain S-box protein [Dehalococcoidia bacterium]